MAGQLNTKLLVASVHNLKVLRIFFDFILFISRFLQVSGTGIHFNNVILQEKNFLYAWSFQFSKHSTASVLRFCT